MHHIILKFLKYCIVGFSGMAIDFSVTWILKEKLHINKYIANSTGFILSATSNFILNRIWTFNSKDDQISTEYFLFISISLFGLFLNNLVIYFLSDKLTWNFYISKAVAIVVVTFSNFFMNYRITFS